MPEKMPKKILFFGDTIGRPGRQALLAAMPEFKEKYKPDFIVMNVENLAHGKGITVKTLAELAPLGVDVFTSGNHVYDKGEFSKEAFDTYPNLLRPANYSPELSGKGYVRIEKDGQGYLIINLNGQVFFEKQFGGGISSPFQEFDKIIEEHKKDGDMVLVDFHAEATSEKRAMGFWTDGRASLVYGTHTHVATADLQILPKGTGYVSDVGMSGAKQSILGVPVQNSLDMFMTGKFNFEVEEKNPIMVNGVYAEVENGLATKVEKIYREVNL